VSSCIRNQQLFSEVYLRELRAAKGPTEHLDAARQTIREWREEYPSLEGTAEQRDYVRQCLSALKIAYSPRPGADGFTLFSDSTRAQATGLCLPVQDDNLGRTEKGRHHQARLVRELRAVGLSWGILTNGRRWRLVHAAAPAPYEQSLETDLDALLAERSFGEFRIFHRFFSGEAFTLRPPAVPPPPLARVVPVKLGLDAYLGESERRTEAVERHLKGRVEPILQRLCLGFVEDGSAEHYTRDDLDEVYRNAIYLLYRVLFLFYAEARELLPVEDPRYQPVSLAALVEKARLREQEGTPDPDPYSLWKRLTHLFVMVDDGDESLGVTAYNGGLFSDTEKPYLKRHKIADSFLAPPLYELAHETSAPGRTGTAAAPVAIDYRDLSVRHLGTLYEGMLEYRLNLTRREAVVVRESGGKRTFIPESEAGGIKKGETVLPPGSVYFADDKGERKASGSYYTPEDVVQYIVTNTVQPKLLERRAALEMVLDEARQARAVAATPEERDRIQRYADARALETVEREVLGLRVLDPAMGSGHFLVAAGQLITDFCVETLNETEWPNEEISTDPLLWKRRVVERCLYGVDKNPLAMELAKLALWIASASRGRPLTFLDPHLKHGNSLYGTPLSRLSTLPTAKGAKAEGGLFRAVREAVIQDALRKMAAITTRDTDSLEAVKAKTEAYVSAEAATRRLRDVSNVWLGSLFGLTGDGDRPVSDAEYAELVEDLSRDYAASQWEARVEGNRALKGGRALEDEHGFFHWELEFPDAVVDGRCQFDAVVANPPYVGTKADRAISSLFETFKCADLYAWIVERSIKATAKYGNLGTIIPLSVMFAGDKSTLRKLILESPSEVRLISCDNNPDAIFESPGSARNRQRTTLVVINGGARVQRVYTSDYLRWARAERSYVFSNIKFADTTSLATDRFIPAIGDERLAEFLLQFRKCKYSVRDLVEDNGTELLCVQSAACYFVSAVPVSLERRNQELLWFTNPRRRDIAFAIINSNVFYWYWRARSDGFWVSRDQILGMPVPEAALASPELVALAEELWGNSSDYAVRQNFNGKMVTTYYFNRRMDLLIAIDKLLMQYVAPDLDLPEDIFAQYKSNSFLRPLDVACPLDSDTENL
jgi:hypothetical protein